MQLENKTKGKGTDGKGAVKGSPDGIKGDGPPGGGMFDLGSRKAVKPGSLIHKCGKEAGKAEVKLRITVDREGNVSKYEVVGGYKVNDCVKKKALEAIKNTKYAADPDGPKVQVGVISLSFHVN